MAANLIKEPRVFKNKAVLIKLETTYGVDSLPTGLVDWIEARNVSLTPMDAEKAERNIEVPFMGSSGSVIVGAWTKLAFDVALVPSGTKGTAPKWGRLLMACGFAETVTANTSVTYNVVSKEIASLTGYINIDGTLHKMMGMRGDVKGKMSAKGIPLLSFTFDSVYVAPVVGPMPTVDRTGWAIEEGVNSANTGPAVIGGLDTVFSAFDWQLGNKMARIDLPGPQVEVAITDRAASASITVLAAPLVDWDPFALARAGTTVPLATTHGSVAGMKVQTDMQVRITGVEYDQIDGMLAYKLALDAPPVLGNDEFALTLL